MYGKSSEFGTIEKLKNIEGHFINKASKKTKKGNEASPSSDKIVTYNASNEEIRKVLERIEKNKQRAKKTTDRLPDVQYNFGKNESMSADKNYGVGSRKLDRQYARDLKRGSDRYKDKR